MSNSHDQSKNGKILPQLANLKPNFMPDDLAPPVDRERLRMLVRKQLPERSARLMLELTLRFRCWQQAYLQILTEELEASNSAAGAANGPVVAEGGSAAAPIKQRQRTPKPVAKKVAAKRAEWEKKVHSRMDSVLHLPTDDQIQCLSALTECGAIDSADPVPLESILVAIRKQGSWNRLQLRDICERAKLDGFVASKSRRRPRHTKKVSFVRTGPSTEGAEETTYALNAPAMEILARVAAGLSGAKGLRQEDRLCFQELVAALKIDPALEEAIQLWMSDFPSE